MSDMANAAIYAFFATCRRLLMTPAAATGLLLICAEGDARTALSRLPTHCADPSTATFLETVRLELRLVVLEQLGDTEPAPHAHAQARLTVVKGGRSD